MMDNPSLNWEKLHDAYYRDRLLCDWEQLELLQDPNTLFDFSINGLVTLNWSTESIQFYQMGQIKPLYDIATRILGKGSVVDIKFKDTLGLEFIIIYNDNIKLLKSWSPLSLDTIPLPEDIQDVIWDYKNGYIVLQQSMDIYFVNWESLCFEIAIKNMDDAVSSKNGQQYKLLTKQQWQVNNDQIVLLDIDKTLQWSKKNPLLTECSKLTSFNKCCVNNEGLICLYNVKSNKLHVYKDTKEKFIWEESLHDVRPIDIKWWASDKIIVTFIDEIRIYQVGSSVINGYISFWFPTNILRVYLEDDLALKIVLTDSIRLITQVNQSTVNTFRIGSIEPSAMLFDSWKLLADQPAKSIERLKDFNLNLAVIDCIQAAYDEFNIDLQKKLLKCATFGKSSLSYKSFDVTMFVDCIETIKLLNLLKKDNIFLTYDQWIKYGIDKIMNLMFLNGQFAEAVQLIHLTKKLVLYPTLLTYWASSRIKLMNNSDDMEILQHIKPQLENVPKGIHPPMFDISQTAMNEGRFKLSRELTLLEENPIKRIAALYELDDNSLALKESILTKNPELTISLILQLRKKLTVSQLTKLLILDGSNTQINTYFNKNNMNYLLDFYRQTDNFIDLAYCILQQGKQLNSVNAILPQLKELYGKVYKMAKISSNLFQRQIQLVEYQEHISQLFNTDFTHCSLDDTLIKLIQLKQSKHVDELVKKFHITPRKFYHIQCKVLIEMRQFDELYTFITKKKSPIGIDTIYRRLLAGGHKTQALRFIPLMTNLTAEQKAQLQLQCQ